MSIKMTVSFRYGATQNIYFDTRESAEAELEALKAKMGKTYRFKNDAEDTHTITTPVGPVVVTLDVLDCARIVDTDVWTRLAQDDVDRDVLFNARIHAAAKKLAE